MTLFRRLYLHYAAAPVRVPDLAPTHRILALLYSPEEAALALGMPLVTRGRASIAELEHASGLAPERVAPALSSMMAKGLVLASGRDDQYRSLWDFFFLMTDVSFARLENSQPQRELAQLREQLWQAGWSHDLFASDYPFARVLPYEGTLEQSAALFEHERAAGIVNTAEAIAFMSSACHVAASHAAPASLQSCSHTTGGYFCFNASAHYFVAHRGARYVDRAEAGSILEAAKASGLVLTAMNQSERIPNVCLCCPVCCIHFRERRESGNSAAIAQSGFQPDFASADCEGCGSCADVCPTSALVRLPPSQGAEQRPSASVGLLRDACVGCGLCAVACPEGAVTLHRVESVPIEKTTQDAWRAFEAQRRW